MWHAFNLIRAGDRVTATTFRKVQRDVGVGTDSQRVKLKLTLLVEAVDFDPEGGAIRLRGKNLTENEHVKLGAYHTLELEVQRPFSIEKEVWDYLDLARVQEACNPALSADLAVVLITEGLANVCLVGDSVTLVKARIEANLPRKRGAGAAGYTKAWSKFLDALMHVDFSIVKCLVIAGPGFSKDQFKEHLNARAVREDEKALIENKSKIIVAPAASAYKHSLKEVLGSDAIVARIKDTKAYRDSQALAAWHDMMGRDPSRAFYGSGHVFAANELGAIQTLLISDNLFRVNDVAKRQKCAQLVEGVRNAGGEVLVLSSMHASGEQLNQLTGIAAILRFPLPDLEEQEFTTEL